MRLIDADKITFFDCLAKTGNTVCCHAEGIVSKSAIEMQPTVEAIPVEWLLKRAKLCIADYANCLRYSIEAWRTEQKCMVNGRWKFPKEWEKENETN